MSFLPEFQDALVALPTVTALDALLPGGLDTLPEDVYDALRRDEVREALEAGEVWLERSGREDPAASLGYVLLLEGCDRLDRALEFAEELREGGYDSQRLRVVEAEIHLERGEEEPAAELLDEVIDDADESDSLDGPAWGFVSDLLLDLGRIEQAMDGYETAIELGSEDYETMIRLGKLYQEHKAWSRAAETFERAAKLRDNVVGPWREAAESWRQAGELERSLDARQHVLDEGPSDAELWAKQGVGYREVGREDEAIEALEKATRLDPRRPIYWLELGHLLLENEQPERAIASYRRVLDFDDAYAEARVGLAAATLAQGNLAGAREAAEEAVDAAPKSADAHFILAETCRAANENDAARNALQRAIELDETTADYHAALGELAMESENFERAYEFLERATELEPDNGRIVASFAEALLQFDAHDRLRTLLERPNDWNATPAWRLVRPLFLVVMSAIDDDGLEPAFDALTKAVEMHEEALPIDVDIDVLDRYALVVDTPYQDALETMIDILEGRASLDELDHAGPDG